MFMLTIDIVSVYPGIIIDVADNTTPVKQTH